MTLCLLYPISMNNGIQPEQTPEQVAQQIVQRNEERRSNHENAGHKRIVEAGGGRYVRGMLGDLVLFDSPQTGSTLAIPEKDLTPANVAAKLKKSNRAFGK